MSRIAAAPPPAPLSADLVKLRDRYLRAFPDSAAGTGLLAYVPVALRHLLSMRLELRRAETLPARYRDVALGAIRDRPVSGDAVDHMVARFALTLRDQGGPGAAALRPEMRRYFTEAQIVELTLLLSIAIAFETFEAALSAP